MKAKEEHEKCIFFINKIKFKKLYVFLVLKVTLLYRVHDESKSYLLHPYPILIPDSQRPPLALSQPSLLALPL